MNWSLTDKLIILVTGILQLFIIGSTETELYVAWILTTLAVLFLTELKRDIGWSIGATVICMAVAPFFPGVLIAFPMALYALAGSPLSSRRGLDIAVRAILSVAMLSEVYYLTGNIVTTAYSLLIMALSGYLAVKTGLARQKETLLLSKFDDARQDSLNAKRLGEEIMKNADNEVYTARLKERNRIAREIHDNVGHMITRVIVQMQAIKIINKDEKVARQLDSVSETLDLAMTGIRKSVHELHDDSIDVSIAVNDIIKTLPERFDVDVNTSIESPADNKTKSCILGIIKEAVTNISKYSSGDKVRIEVVENNTFWRILVRDNGENPERDYMLTGDYMASGGLGLKNIASRAASCGGRASVRSGKDGFEIIATLPKAAEA
jgi:signal transduction histidine kinase